MKPQTWWADLQQTNACLAKTADSNYLLVLRRVVASLPAHECFAPIASAVRRGCWKSIYEAGVSLSSQKHDDAHLYYCARQVAALIKKYPFDPTLIGVDPKAAALKTFYSGETRCRRINMVFRKRRANDFASCSYGPYLRSMQRFIAYVLGEFDLDQVLDSCDWGPGANVGVSGDTTHILRKIGCEKHTVTHGATIYAERAILRNEHLARFFYAKCSPNSNEPKLSSVSAMIRNCFDIIDHNKIAFAPKTVDTFRTIASEPIWNSFLQKGADTVMRLRLLRIGIDLRDQSKNQRLAREGSLDDSPEGFVTVDLKNASGTLALEVTRTCLWEAPEWLTFLSNVRSPSYRLPQSKENRRYEMFGSMGNGTTFPLETLIFTAACHAAGCGVPGTDYSVYGDDIIVRKKHVEKLIWLLAKLGFTVNRKKTCISGPFRESCGEDYFGGVAVRPYTLDHKLDSVQNMFKALNLCRLRPHNEALLWPSFRFLADKIPVNFRFWRPFKGNPETGIDTGGDEHLLCQHVRNVPLVRGNATMGWKWKELVSRAYIDLKAYDGVHDESLMYVLLRGATPVGEFESRGNADYAFYPSVTHRRKTKQSIACCSGGGATSNWLPNTDSL